MSDPVIRCRQLHRSFGDGTGAVHVLRELDMDIQSGESVAIVGASGSGKSTLLHLLAGLDQPDAGKIEFLGQEIGALDDKALARLRNEHLGFVYQMHHLLPEFSALENVALPKMLSGVTHSEARQAAMTLLERVDLAPRAEHRPGELSGGERQRVAVCRALVMEPEVILADEPTGNLDPQTAQGVFRLLREMNEERGGALVLVTHDRTLASAMAVRYQLIDGKAERGD